MVFHHRPGFVYWKAARIPRLNPFDILEFGGESPLPIRARCSAFRYCPDPLGIVTAKQLNKLEFISVLLLQVV